MRAGSRWPLRLPNPRLRKYRANQPYLSRGFHYRQFRQFQELMSGRPRVRLLLPCPQRRSFPWRLRCSRRFPQRPQWPRQRPRLQRLRLRCRCSCRPRLRAASLPCGRRPPLLRGQTPSSRNMPRSKIRACKTRTQGLLSKRRSRRPLSGHPSRFPIPRSQSCRLRSVPWYRRFRQWAGRQSCPVQRLTV